MIASQMIKRLSFTLVLPRRKLEMDTSGVVLRLGIESSVGNPTKTMENYNIGHEEAHFLSNIQLRTKTEISIKGTLRIQAFDGYNTCSVCDVFRLCWYNSSVRGWNLVGIDWKRNKTSLSTNTNTVPFSKSQHSTNARWWYFNTPHPKFQFNRQVKSERNS